MFCIGCNQNYKVDEGLSFFPTSTHKLKIFDEMKILCCSECGLGVVSEDVDENDLSEYYRASYGGLAKKYALTDIDSPLKSQVIDYRSISQITLIKTYMDLDESKTVLEIGSGKGDFYAALKDLSLNCKYVTYEPQKEAKEKLNHMGIEVINKSFEPNDAAKNDSKYDLIVMSHCLEHFHPAKVIGTIESIYKMLKPGGYFFCEVPNAELLKYPNAGERVVPHLTFFSILSLKKILIRNNFDLNFIKTCGNLQRDKDAGSIIEEYEKKGMFRFKEDQHNSKILRNIYFDDFLESEAKKKYRKNNIIRFILRLLGEKLSIKLFKVLGKIRKPSIEKVLSTEYFNYKEDAEFIRLLAKK